MKNIVITQSELVAAMDAAGAMRKKENVRPPGYFTRYEFAQHQKIPDSTAYDWLRHKVSAGEIEKIKVGRLVLYGKPKPGGSHVVANGRRGPKRDAGRLLGRLGSR